MEMEKQDGVMKETQKTKDEKIQNWLNKSKTNIKKEYA